MIIIIINVIILARITFLCLVKKDYYEKTLENNNLVIEGMTAPRGRILDTNGHILADNLGVKSIIYNKLNISSKREMEIAKLIADNITFSSKPTPRQLRYYFYQLETDLINNRLDEATKKAYNERKINNEELLDIKLSLINEDELNSINPSAAYIYYLMNNGYSYQDKIIKDSITDEEYILINSLNLEGIRTDITWERIYPYGSVLRDIIGNVSSYEQGLTMELKDEYLKKGYKLDDRVGITNLEYIYDDYLKGEKATYSVKNNRLTLLSDFEKGKDIILSIDIELQIKLEQILEEEILLAKKAMNTKYYNGSYLVVGNPSDGSIIALVGKEIKKKKFIDTSYYNILNSYTVGSVIKGASISVGYKNNLINEKTKVIDGCIQLYSQRPKCSWASLGYINDVNALRQSSNYFQYLIAIKLTGNKKSANLILNANENHFNEYREVFKSYGLGNMTGIDLTNENTGMKGSIISDDLLLNISIGQYDTYTPVSLIQYINTIATGERSRLHLLKEVINNDGTLYYKYEKEVLNKAPIDNKYLKRIREGFKAVNENGTGSSYTDHSFTSAGKTGTAESFFDGKSTITTTYVMYAPYNNPEYSIAVVSPHISYSRTGSSYKYPINSKLIKKVSNILMK